MRRLALLARLVFPLVLAAVAPSSPAAQQQTLSRQERARLQAEARALRVDSLVRRADSLSAAGDTLGALAQLDTAVDLDVRAAPAWHRRGMLALRYAGGREIWQRQRARWIRYTQLADTSLRLAAAFAPDSARYALDLGRFLMTASAGGPVMAPGVLEKGVAAGMRTGDSLALSQVADAAGMAHWLQYEGLSKMHGFAHHYTFEDILARVNNTTLGNFLDENVVPYDPPLGSRHGILAGDLFVLAFRSDPNNLLALQHTWMMEAEHGRWQEMLDAAALRLRVAPWDPWAWMARGLASNRLGMLREATVAFDSAMVLLSPRDRTRLARLTRILRPSDGQKLAAMSPAARRVTERLYWVSSDPLALSSGNEHWVEFLTRVAYAELRFSPGDSLRLGAESQRGQVYVRYGPPDTIVSGKTREDRVMTLWYYRSGMAFIFPGNGMRWFQARPVSWDNLAVTTLIDSMPVQVTRFRAAARGGSPDADSTDVVLFAEVPIGRLMRGLDLTSASVDVGLFAFDQVARLLVRDSSRQELRLGAGDSVKTVMRSWRVRLPAAGDVAYRVEALQPTSRQGARHLGTTELTRERGFGASDLLLAERIGPGVATPTRWSDLLLTPTVGTVARGQQIAVLWETYELAAAPDSANRYRVDVRLEKRDSSAVSKLVARVLGTLGAGEVQAQRKERGVTLEFTRALRATPVALDYITLDLGDTDAGSYRLTVTVMDLVSGRSVARSRELTVLQ